MKYALKNCMWAPVPCTVLLLSMEGATGQPAAAAPCLCVGRGGSGQPFPGPKELPAPLPCSGQGNNCGISAAATFLARGTLTRHPESCSASPIVNK